MPPLNIISEIFGREKGEKYWEREKNIAGKLKYPLKALFSVLLYYMQIFGVYKPVNMHMVMFLQQNLTNSP